MIRYIEFCYLLLTLLAHTHGLRIAFGSCNKQSEQQPFWEMVADRRPDKLLLGGDNIYADIRDFSQFYKMFSKHSIFHPATPEHLSQQYELLNEQPGFQRAVQTIGWDNIHTTWDDHDFGINDGDKLYKYKKESKEIFLNFWREPQNSVRRQQEDGVYTSVTQEDHGHIVKYILLDERYNKDPYDTSDGDFLGEKQWKWLEQELNDPQIDVAFIVSSLQVIGDDKIVGEFWGRFPQTRERMLSLLAHSPIANVFILSGDVHYAEISEVTCGSRSILDITSSGMTHSWTGSGRTRSIGYNIFQRLFPAHYRRSRLEDQFGGLNMAEFEIKWAGNKDSNSVVGNLKIRILDQFANAVIEREVVLRPRGYYQMQEISECLPYWGPVLWYQKLGLWVFLASLLVVFVILPVLELIWIVVAAGLWIYVYRENKRRDRLEEAIREAKKND